MYASPLFIGKNKRDGFWTSTSKNETYCVEVLIKKRKIFKYPCRSKGFMFSIRRVKNR